MTATRTIKRCKERVPEGFPNIMSFVGLREKAAEKRKSGREEEEREREQKQTERRQERTKLRYELSRRNICFRSVG